MRQFQGGLFDTAIEEKYLLTWFSKIETVYEFLTRFPASCETRFFAEDLVQRWIEGREYERVVASVF